MILRKSGGNYSKIGNVGGILLGGTYPDCRVWRRMDDPTQVFTDASYNTDPLCDPDFGDIKQPDRYLSPYYYFGPQNNGGVHHNIGVGNKLAYLLTDGDTFNGYTIDGMGISAVADLFYDCQINRLMSGSGFSRFGKTLSSMQQSILDSHRMRLIISREHAELLRFTLNRKESFRAEYLVITSADLADPDNITNSNYSFQALCESKQERGLTTAIVTTEWIYANYDGTTPYGEAHPNGQDYPIEDNQTRIRNFLIDAYENWGAKYVFVRWQQQRNSRTFVLLQ